MPQQKVSTQKINKSLDNIDARMKDIFKQTYYSSNDGKKIVSDITTGLEDIIDRVVKGDPNSEDLSNTTRMYSRIKKKIGDGNTGIMGEENMDSMSALFNDNQFLGELINTYADTRWVRQLDDEYDMLIHYMPKLKTALDIKRDNVLCSDSFTKGFLNISKKSGTDTGDKFNADIAALITKYNLNERFEQMYDDASLYGESFLYLVPYNKAFSELLARKKDTGKYGVRREQLVISESGITSQQYNTSTPAVHLETSTNNNAMALNIKLNKTCILEDVVENYDKASKILQKNVMKSMHEAYMDDVLNESSSSAAAKTKVTLDRTVPDELEHDNELMGAVDGLVNPKDEKIAKTHVPGSVMKTIERWNIIPLYIEDMCLGYYYINQSLEGLSDNNVVMNQTFNTIGEMYGKSTTPLDTQGDEVLKRISGAISTHIDAQFINANQDISREIYMMLKYNDKFNRQVAPNLDVTFIPPEDIIHFKFRTDPKSHRGISDLFEALIPAKMWIMLNTTLSLGVVTRGQDRRVYYVKQSVETNVARSLLNVISQIKKGNFGIRQMESINNILGILGKFNDFVIPVGPSGDAPINFEIMPGQQIDMPTELMNGLEESAVNSTDVPLEVVQASNQMDFAVRFSMTNSKFLRILFKRQSKCEVYYSDIVTKLYNYEYNENYQLVVSLPAPTFLTVMNGASLIQNAKSYIDAITEVEMADATDAEKVLFQRKMLRYYLPTYINSDIIDGIKDEIKLDLEIKKSKDAITADTTEEQ